MSGQQDTQSIDDLIACVIGMGFSLEDAQQAVSLGKLNTEEAIEWILAGKPVPQAPTPGPTLRLQSGESMSSNPFSNPQPTAIPPSGAVAAVSPPSVGGVARPQGEDMVVSRVHLDEEQRQIKERFEEKQRDEARRSAKIEKAAAKKAHAQILRQIQDDRESQRLRRGAGSSKADGAIGSTSPRAKEPRTEPATPPSAEEKKCLLQIRLPDGRAIRQSFQPDAVLQEVWNYVMQQVKVANDMALIQPFPRQEYGTEHMLMTLTQLGLAPSGSLVLNKKVVTKEVPAATAASAEVAVSPNSPDSGPPNSPPGEDAWPGSPPPTSPPFSPPMPDAHVHMWGEGQRMVEDQPAEEGDGDQEMEEPAVEEVGPAADPEDPPDDDEDDDDDDMQEGGGWGPGVGGGAGGGGWGPGAGGGGGWGGWGGGGGGGGGGWGQDMEGHQWGEGQRLMGEVLAPDNLPHHAKTAKAMAAEAAGERFAHPIAPQPAAAGPSSAKDQLAPPAPSLPSLVELLIRHVSTRVCDSQHPITSFQGLPADVAMKILAHLIKERLLRPKTLHPFLSCCLRKMVLDCYPYTTNKLLYALRRHTYLTYLSVVDCPLITDKGLTTLTSLKRLKYLNLSNCRQITDTCIPTLQEFPNLVTLVLDNTVVTDAGVCLYCQRAPPGLQHLTLNHTDVTDAVFHALRAFPRLKSLNLEGTQICSLEGLEQLTTLEHLNLSNNKLAEGALTRLASMPHLVALNISLTLNTAGAGLNGDEALQAIQSLPLQLLELPDRHTTTDRGIEYISRMPLQTLDLTYYIHVTDAAAPFIGALTSLTRLRLSNTKMTDAGMPYLTALKNLRELYLNRTAITDMGAAIVAEFSHLQELGLMSTGITNAFLIGGTLSRCRQLSKLNLSRTYISNRGVSQLTLPCLTLLNLDCTKVTNPVEVTLRKNCPQLKKVMLSNLQPITDEDIDM